MARRSRYRWNDWRVDPSGRSVKSNPKKDSSRPITPRPTQKQLDYIAALAGKLGRKIKRPKTRSEASAVIDSLKSEVAS